MGLSPLARGKRSAGSAEMPFARPIPAGAGETAAPVGRAGAPGAYPRWRGGNKPSGRKSEGREGLSPLARGKLTCFASPIFWRGPIPAGAGETFLLTVRNIKVGAYPRWRGGNLRRTWSPVPCSGLSPLARGKRLHVAGGPAPWGPIPAGAGETPTATARRSRSRAYPRWRGGNDMSGPGVERPWGLSPLARGKLTPCDPCQVVCGPIPAGAGETRAYAAPPAAERAYPRWRGGNFVPGCHSK